MRNEPFIKMWVKPRAPSQPLLRKAQHKLKKMSIGATVIVICVLHMNCASESFTKAYTVLRSHLYYFSLNNDASTMATTSTAKYEKYISRDKVLPLCILNHFLLRCGAFWLGGPHRPVVKKATKSEAFFCARMRGRSDKFSRKHFPCGLFSTVTDR